MSDKKRVIYVVGPTASGKTELGIGLAKALNGEIVSADSMQIYRDMHIASAAPDDKEREGIIHHLIEFLDYGQEYSVADYVLEAREKIADILSRGKTPIVVGGTGLYINSLADNIEYAPDSSDQELRARLENEFDEMGREEMLKRLSSIDCDAARKLHINDRRRIIRALEIYYSTGKTLTEQNIESRKNAPQQKNIMLGVSYADRQRLYERINLRVDKMLSSGLLKEAEQAFVRIGKNGRGALQAIGHKELFPYFEGKEDLEAVTENLKRATRRYAKRQLTWFRRDERIFWIYRDECESALKEALRIIESEG